MVSCLKIRFGFVSDTRIRKKVERNEKEIGKNRLTMVDSGLGASYDYSGITNVEAS